MFDRWKKIEVTVYRVTDVGAPARYPLLQRYYFEKPTFAKDNGNYRIDSKTFLISKRELDKIFNSYNCGLVNPMDYTAAKVYQLAYDAASEKEKEVRTRINKAQYQNIVDKVIRES